MQSADPVQDNPLLRTTDRRAVRCKRVLISCALLQQLVTQGSDSADFPWGARCTQGLPADARLVHSYVLWHGSGAALAMVFEHAEWPAIPEGQLIPELVVRFEQYPRTPDAPLAAQPAAGDGDPREAGQATDDR